MCYQVNSGFLAPSNIKRNTTILRSKALISPQEGSISVYGITITTIGIVNLFLVKLEKNRSLNAICTILLDSSFPEPFKERVQDIIIFTSIDLIDKGDICAIGKYKRKLIVLCRKNIVDTIHCAINYLYVFHTMIISSVSTRFHHGRPDSNAHSRQSISHKILTTSSSS